MTTSDTPAQQALARLVADQKRPSGVTEWCDKHRADVELVVRELGIPTLALAVNMAAATLYSWCARRSVPSARRPPGPHPAEAPAPAPTTVATPDGPAHPQRESADYYRGLAAGLQWAIEKLAPRP